MCGACPQRMVGRMPFEKGQTVEAIETTVIRGTDLTVASGTLGVVLDGPIVGVEGHWYEVQWAGMTGRAAQWWMLSEQIKAP